MASRQSTCHTGIPKEITPLADSIKPVPPAPGPAVNAAARAPATIEVVI
ncbi:MAG: hypothetical protein R3220_05065 [Balneolaceae bacterium]|nr:hypothetical protein [Balneolaceae bacterium]